LKRALNHLIVVLGPTASGKSNLGIQIAKEFDGEIISADSMQIYRGFDIGTAKIKPAETEGIPHHLIDIKDPNESFSVSEYQKLARETIEDIFKRKKTPILVGGTGLYIDSTLYNYDFADISEEQREENIKWRNYYQDFAKKEGKTELYNLLKETDPETAFRLHPNDVKRIIRALEYYKIHGRPISQNTAALTDRTNVFSAYIIGLTMERAVLYQRINERVDQMIKQGLIEEVKRLLQNGCSPASQAMQGIGYRQIVYYLEGRYTLEQAVEAIKQETRRYAKRQFTWFRRNPDINWYDIQKTKTTEIIDDLHKLV